MILIKKKVNNVFDPLMKYTVKKKKRGKERFKEAPIKTGFFFLLLLISETFSDSFYNVLIGFDNPECSFFGCY